MNYRVKKLFISFYYVLFMILSLSILSSGASTGKLIENDFTTKTDLLMSMNDFKGAEQVTWIAFFLCLFYMFLILLLAIIKKPWKNEGFNLHLPSMTKPLLLLAICCVAPILLLENMGYPLDDTWFIMVILSLLVITFFFIKMISPISKKYHLVLYYCLSLLLIVSSIYISFYVSGNLSLLWTLIKF